MRGWRLGVAMAMAPAVAACADRGPAGHLPAAPQPAPIPAAFVGVWNDEPASCHSGRSDTELRVTARALQFHESETVAARVTVHGPRAITVEGDAIGEGERWPARFELRLSRSGRDLVVDGFTRHRCPDS